MRVKNTRPDPVALDDGSHLEPGQWGEVNSSQPRTAWLLGVGALVAAPQRPRGGRRGRRRADQSDAQGDPSEPAEQASPPESEPDHSEEE